MAPAFARSISFPLSPARASSRAAAAAARHVRSISLPTSARSSHPLLAHLHDAIRSSRLAAASPSPAAGLAHLHALLAALAEVLLLPEARAASAPLLDAFLALADAHGAFQEALLALGRHAADAQAALRRRDAARLASALRAQRHADRDLARLASAVRAAAKVVPHPTEVSAVLHEAVAAVAAASAAVFEAVEALSSSATTAAAASSSRKTAATLIYSLVTRTKASSDEDREAAALQRFQGLEECIADMQVQSDKVFRSILRTRVALLNIQTHTAC